MAGWGTPAPILTHRAVPPGSAVRPGRCLCAKGGVPDPTGGGSSPHSGKPQGTKGLLRRSLMQHGERRRGGQGLWNTAVSPSPHHSPVQPAPSTQRAASRPPTHFGSMSLCLHPRANSKKKKKVIFRSNLWGCVSALSSTPPPQHPALASHSADPGLSLP